MRNLLFKSIQRNGDYMNNIIIECDTRQQKDKHIIDYFERNEIRYIRNKLYAGDYKLTNSNRVIIDTKKDLMEVCGNLANSSNHERIKREIQRAKDIGCERFIFLIAHAQIRFVDEVYTWKVPKSSTTGLPRTKVKSDTLQRIMETMSKRYGIEFIFCSKVSMGKVVYELLTDTK